MNPITNEFEPVTAQTPSDWPRFAEGQQFVLNGVTLKVRKITKKDIILRPVKAGTK